MWTSILRNIDRAKKLGYVVEIFYVGIESPDKAKERIAKRVEQGGHGIPDKDVERRYYESINNLKKIISMCDLVIIYDNTELMSKIATYKSGTLKTKVKELPKWFEKNFMNIEEV